MNLRSEVEEYGAAEHAALASRRGLNEARPVKIDASTFTRATHYANGWLPAFVVLAVRTSDKVVVRYNNAGSGGAEVAAGFLRSSIKVAESGATAVANADYGALLERGDINLSELPAGHGFDENARADLVAAGFKFIGTAA